MGKRSTGQSDLINKQATQNVIRWAVVCFITNILGVYFMANKLSEEAKEEMRRYKREWQRNNRDKVNAYRRRYYQENKEKHKRNMARYWERKAQKRTEEENNYLSESN